MFWEATLSVRSGYYTHTLSPELSGRAMMCMLEQSANG